MHVDGIPFKLCLYFVRNPGAVMFVQDIAEKWNVPARQLWSYLSNARKGGVIEARQSGRETYYVAGPALMAALADL
jgi:DNA-binding IscR family transcriptional regulator